MLAIVPFGQATPGAARHHRRSARPLDGLKGWIVVVAAAGLALLSIFRVVDLWSWRNDLLAEGTSHADNLAHILAEYVTSTFVATDAALRQLQGHGRTHEASAADWDAVLASMKSTLTGAGSISVTDASGVIRYSTQPVIIGQSRRALPIFQQLVNSPTDDLAIDPPFLTVSEPHHYVLPVARRIERPDGSFNGILVVVFEPSQLQRFFRSVDVGRGGAISIRHRNGQVLYREPSVGDAIGTPAMTDEVLIAARQKPDGTLRHTLPPNRTPVITAFHTTGAPPLIVSVSLSETALLAEWRREAIGSLGALAAFSLLVVGGAVVAFRQIDRRTAAEEALRAMGERTEFALEAARVGTWEVDLTTGAASWSPTLEALHGVTSGQFGRTFRAFVDLIHPADREEVERTLERATIDKTDANILYRTTWPDGTIHWMSGVGRTFFDDLGHPVRSAGVIMDVTDRRRMEEQFRQSQKLESIGQLAAGVAHDFNNLLTAILGHCELLNEPGQGEAGAAQHSISEIRRASERAASLTQQLLAFGRRQMLAPRVLDLGASLTAIEPMLRRLIREDIKVVVRVAPNLAHVHIDPGQIEQVILNLALNGRDAMPEGGVLTLELANVELDDAYARQHPGAHPGLFAMLSVSDSGIGMDAVVQARIFEPFFTTKEQGKGTGLGLATVYGIVEQSGGHVLVYSEPGHGSTFKVYLPAVDAPIDAPVPIVPVNMSRGSETILVVEDEPGVRALLQRVLTGRGYRVLAAATPADALNVEQSTRESIHLVISDVVLPEMSGPVLIQRLRLNRPDLRVLYVSGYTEHAVAQNGLLGGHESFLPKPFTAAALLQKVRELLA